MARRKVQKPTPVCWNQQWPSAWAWWYLSQTEKEELQEARAAGMFGGRPGQAPYWHIAEWGHNLYASASAFGGHHYIANTAGAMPGRFDQIIRSYLNT